ncbi:MAG: dihydroorotate dehydrogenase electron transfer subunit [Lachnospiraceae bacterium]|nr:dihydroorotate dehydrogenase electron transfer subunit [Lachnospiraceae bacterium]
MKDYGTYRILSQSCLQDGIYSMVLDAPGIAKQAEPGQFVCLYTDDSAKLLPRPISICDVDPAAGTLRLVYRVVGFGTKEFSEKCAGDTVTMLGPIGSGYTKVAAGAEVPRRILVGGGIGIPPMLLLAKEWKKAGYEVHAVLGYRTKDTFLLDDMKQYAECHIATDDGSLGTHGTVIDAIRAEGLIPEGSESSTLFAACGPMPMLRGLAKEAGERGVECYVSLEERMACGIGACLGCIVKTSKKDAHSHVNNARICTEGPVFDAKDIAW